MKQHRRQVVIRCFGGVWTQTVTDCLPTVWEGEAVAADQSDTDTPSGPGSDLSRLTPNTD